MSERNRKAKFKAAWEDLIRKGLIVPTGEWRNGHPVYVAVVPPGWSAEQVQEALDFGDQ